MTTAPHWLDEFYPPSALVDKPRALDKYTVEALGTFGLVLTVGVGLCSGSPFAALGIGVVLMARRSQPDSSSDPANPRLCWK